MSDPLHELESELSRLAPRRLPAELPARIAAELDRPAPSEPSAPRKDFAERWLIGFMGCGALAASVIVGLIGWQVLENRRPAPVSPPVVNAPPNIAAYQQALARSDEPTLELLR